MGRSRVDGGEPSHDIHPRRLRARLSDSCGRLGGLLHGFEPLRARERSRLSGTTPRSELCGPRSKSALLLKGIRLTPITFYEKSTDNRHHRPRWKLSGRTPSL